MASDLIVGLIVLAFLVVGAWMMIRGGLGGFRSGDPSKGLIFVIGLVLVIIGALLGITLTGGLPG